MLAALFSGAVLAGAASAGDKIIEHLGGPVYGMTVRVVKIEASTPLIKVLHSEALTIENQKGQRFTWRFDTLHIPTGFPLESIAPPGFDAGDTWVYVSTRHHSGSGWR